MKRVPLGVVAVLVAAALAAAAFARHRRTQTGATRSSPRPKDAASSSAPLPIVPHGLGAGPPPSDERSPGVFMLHGDPRHTHRAVGRAPRSSPIPVWSHDVGGPVEAQITTSSDQQTLYVATLGGSLTALARADGVARWSVALGDRAYATPCVAHDGTIYVGSDSKRLLAVSPEGKIKWSLETEGDADTGPVIASDEIVVFAAGRTVYGVTPFGHVTWRFTAKRKVFSSPAIGRGGRVFFGSQDHRAYALTEQGVLAWSVDLGADIDGAPAVGDDGAVFVGTDGDEIVRLDPDGGAIIWRSNVGGYVRGTLSVARGGDVLAGVYGPTPREVRLRPGDGSVVGQFAIQGTGAREFGVHGGALEDETGMLLFGAQDDDVYAVGETGDLLWRFSTGGDVDAPVTLLTDGSVVVGSDDGHVYLLRAM
ncbi:MAG TPA: PQQ-binding-like beta-propeller repeat protein [Polyangiaceae bacterium]|nr:PQQ-binding-like beta-propeller repeat protein [Polyangiaceae bacterium]